MKEQWVDVKGFEKFYQVSNYGVIKSKPRYRAKVLMKPKILKQFPNSCGYYRVCLTDGRGNAKKIFVHRLVALHFVTNPDAKINNVVNHLDSNHTNNRADNLEWTTEQGNREHAVRNGRMKRTEEWKRWKRKFDENNGKSVVGINIKTGKAIRFICLNDCRKKGFEPSCVCDCCKGKRQTHKGYRWQYEQIQTNESSRNSA